MDSGLRVVERTRLCDFGQIRTWSFPRRSWVVFNDMVELWLKMVVGELRFRIRTVRGRNDRNKKHCISQPIEAHMLLNDIPNFGHFKCATCL